MKVGTVLVATDTNPLYCDFIPLFVKAWKTLIPEADVCIVMIANEIPERFRQYSEHIKLFPPIEGIHTAFQAQCIRLLYPRLISRDEGVLITDMDMLPMRRSYYTDPIANISGDTFVVYRDVCLPGEISMCYNIAHPAVWRGVFGEEDAVDILRRWYAPTNYDGQHGGVGWGTDQVILVKMFNEWNGPKVVLNDTITRFGRLDRIHPWVFADKNALKARIQKGEYADYHCMRPYSENKEINDFVVNCLPGGTNVFSFCLYGPETPKYYFGLMENIRLINEHFPDWKIFVYLGNDVPESFISKLRTNPSVILRHTGVDGHKNSIYRFFAIDEPSVTTMMVRDADSRVHWKDRWAIRNFIESSSGVHIIRDHIEHTIQILAGLWGIKKSALSFSIQDAYKEWTPIFAGSGDKNDPNGFGIDQNFLKMVLYPRLASSVLVHYSNNRLMIGEVGIEFPFEWKNDVYCGRVELEYMDKYYPDNPHKKRPGLNLPKGSVRLSAAAPSPAPAPAQPVPAVKEIPLTIREPPKTPLFLNFLNRK